MPETAIKSDQTTLESWAQQVIDEHRELRWKKDELRTFLIGPRPRLGAAGAHSWAAGLARRLLSLHDELFRHFRFEEEGGMAAEVTTRHPRASAAIGRLMGEHGEMLRRLRQLVDESLAYSEGTEPEDPALRIRVEQLLDELERHEADENEMIQDLELLDLGLGD